MKIRSAAQQQLQPIPFPVPVDGSGAETARLRRFSMQPDGEESQGRLHRYVLESRFLAEAREVTVYLPAMYASQPQRRFPVMYLHDGQNLFDGRTSYVAGHTWKAHETADRLMDSDSIEPLILVGIANTGAQRLAEYTPTEDPHMGGGQGRDYGRLLVEELKPFVDEQYRTVSESEGTGLGGSSLGGLITLFLGLRYPHVFGRLAVISPSIWWNQRSVLDYVTIYSDPIRPRIWLDIGTAEGGRHVRDADLLHRLLLSKGWRDDVDLQYRKFANAEHTEDAWADRFDQVLSFLFPAGSSR